MPRPARFAPLSLLLLAAGATASDCDRGRALYEAATREAAPQGRVVLLTQSTDACPDPVAFGALAQAHLAAGEPTRALEALRQAADTSDDAAQQVQIHALMARIYLAQGRLPEAIGTIGAAFDRARGPVPDWVLEVRRAVDKHPGRARLSAAGIGQALAVRGLPSKGFTPVPRVDLYILFDFDQDSPNAEGLTQVEALADALTARAAVAGERYRLIGHTDTQGPAAYNQDLSERRAGGLLRLVETRDPRLAGRLVSEGRGETRPLYPGDTKEDHRLNRRVEVAVEPAP